MLKPRKSIAIHPGEILQEILTQNSLTQVELAKRINVTHAKINEICRAKRSITADMAMKLARVFKQSPAFWSNLQGNWEISQLNPDDYSDIEAIKIRA